jgi:hypothetical protein
LSTTTDPSSQKIPPDAKFVTVTELPKLNYVQIVSKPFRSTTPIFSVSSTTQVDRIPTTSGPISDISSSESLCKVRYHTLP